MATATTTITPVPAFSDDLETTAPAGEDLYGFSRWSADLVRVLPNGNVGLCNPAVPDQIPTDLLAVVKSLQLRGIRSPILLRVADFLKYRIDRLNGAFTEAIDELEYRGTYQGVFPIKVNQQAQVVDRIIDYGRVHNFGLEVGSKAELLIALSHELGPKAAIICNGVKDESFLRLALMSQRLGFNTFIVLESPREVDLVLNIADEVNIRPRLGVRIKLTNTVSGNWARSSGDRSTFGMTVAQVMEVVEAMGERDYLDCLVLQHSHLGSQIGNILEIRQAVQEACRFYCELSAVGANLSYLDIGGGLGVDYTGEHAATANSVNYSLEEYAVNVVDTVKIVMDEHSIEHPTIVTESGRACVAHSSMLLFNIIDVTEFTSSTPVVAEADDHPYLASILEIEEYLSLERVQECWNDLAYYRGEIRQLFGVGRLSLKQAAKAERAHLYLLSLINDLLARNPASDVELPEGLDLTADIYHGNFSLFQSLPDIWAIDQLHPIAPIHRLNETPTRHAVISDMTCDSDGTIGRFVLADGIASTLPVHKVEPDEDYYLGVFFIGAYQETLGDLHNMFGDTNVVTIGLDGRGGFEVLHEQEGDTVAEVMSYVEYSPRGMLDRFKAIVERGVASGRLSPTDRRHMIASFKQSINGYTYFEGS